MTEETKEPEGLIDRTMRFAGEVAACWIAHPIAQAGRWIRRKILFFVLGLVLLCVAAVFILIGGLLGLQELRVPYWASYLIAGAFAALVGAVVITRK